MRKSSLYRALARATGEHRARLRQIGFTLVRVIHIPSRPERNRKFPRK